MGVSERRVNPAVIREIRDKRKQKRCWFCGGKAVKTLDLMITRTHAERTPLCKKCLKDYRVEA
jgi:hypothetical protein